MSDFRPSQIAPYLEKSAKQLVRWCEQEKVPGAVRTAGGHWRISGESLQSVVEAVRSAAPTNTRRRKENAYPDRYGFRGIPGAGTWLRFEGYLHKSRRTKPAEPAADTVPSTTPESLADWWLKYPPKEPTPREVWQRFFSRNPTAAMFQQDCRRSGAKGRYRMVTWNSGKTATYNLRTKSERARFLRDAVEGFRAGVFLEDKEREHCSFPAGQTFKKSISATAVARSAGIPLRTFYRWFPGWRREVFEGVQIASDKLAFEKVDKDRSAPVAVVQFDGTTDPARSTVVDDLQNYLYDHGVFGVDVVPELDEQTGGFRLIGKPSEVAKATQLQRRWIAARKARRPAKVRPQRAVA
jgi:hypothetical protein